MPDTAPVANATPDPDGVFVDIAVLEDDAWSDSSGADPRGYFWRAPGTYIIAAWSDTGRQLAEVKVEYAFDREGQPVHQQQLVNAIAAALHDLYYPQP